MNRRYATGFMVVHVFFALAVRNALADEKAGVALAAALRQSVLPPGQTLDDCKKYCRARIAVAPNVDDAEKWKMIAADLRRKLLDEVVFKGETAKSWRSAPLHVEYRDEIEGGEDYRIRRLRYEILPGMWTSAVVYEPKKFAGKVPVVLNVNGHETVLGKASVYKQTRCINQARRGMIALNPEWIGMGQLNTPGFSHFRMNQIDLCGESGLAVFYLAMSRALDVLLDHQYADPSRVAVTGLSGGGWQTILLSALDERVTVCNPVAGYSSLLTRLDHAKDLGDAEQIPSDMGRIADYTHLTAMLAPRAALLTYNSKDDCCFESGYALPPLVDAARPIYRLLGHEDRLTTHVNDDPGTHNFERDNREALYRLLGDRFFANQPYDASEIDVSAELKTAEQLNTPLPEGNLDLHTLAKKLAHSLPVKQTISESPDAAAANQASSRKRLAEVVRFGNYDLKAEKAATTTLQQSGNRAVVTTAWRLKIGEEWTVPAIELTPPDAKRTVVVLHDEGRAAASETVARLLDDGVRVVAVDPFGLGESRIAVGGFAYAYIVASVGQRPLGVGAGQLASVARWLQNQHGQPVEIHASGYRVCSLAAVAAALETESIGALHLQGGLKSFGELIDRNVQSHEAPELFCFGLLREFDLPQIIELISPREIKRID